MRTTKNSTKVAPTSTPTNPICSAATNMVPCGRVDEEIEVDYGDDAGVQVDIDRQCSIDNVSSQNMEMFNMILGRIQELANTVDSLSKRARTSENVKPSSDRMDSRVVYENREVRTPTSELGTSGTGRSGTMMSTHDATRVRKVDLPLLDLANLTDLRRHLRLCKTELQSLGFTDYDELAVKVRLVESLKLCKELYFEARSLMEHTPWEELEKDLIHNYAHPIRIAEEVEKSLEKLCFSPSGTQFITSVRLIYNKYRELGLPTEGFVTRIVHKVPAYFLSKVTASAWKSLINGRRLEQLNIHDFLEHLKIAVDQSDLVSSVHPRRIRTNDFKGTNDFKVQTRSSNDKVLVISDYQSRDKFVAKYQKCICAFANEEDIRQAIAGDVPLLICRSRKNEKTFGIIGVDNARDYEKVADGLYKQRIKYKDWDPYFPKKGSHAQAAPSRH